MVCICVCCHEINQDTYSLTLTQLESNWMPPSFTLIIFNKKILLNFLEPYILFVLMLYSIPLLNCIFVIYVFSKINKRVYFNLAWAVERFQISIKSILITNHFPGLKSLDAWFIKLSHHPYKTHYTQQFILHHWVSMPPVRHLSLLLTTTNTDIIIKATSSCKSLELY